jgi:hypothetical protein
MDSVENTTDPRDLQEKIAAKVANDGELSDVEREQVAAAIQSKAKTLGVKLEIATVRGWVRARVRGSGGFIHLNDDGHPLCTLENFRALVEKLQWTIRYNVIKKAIEILIPGESFTRDNRDNAALACMLSECEKVRMPTKHIAQYLIRVADENQYNPVATWVLSPSRGTGCHVWISSLVRSRVRSLSRTSSCASGGYRLWRRRSALTALRPKAS